MAAVGLHTEVVFPRLPALTAAAPPCTASLAASPWQNSLVLRGGATGGGLESSSQIASWARLGLVVFVGSRCWQRRLRWNKQQQQQQSRCATSIPRSAEDSNADGKTAAARGAEPAKAAGKAVGKAAAAGAETPEATLQNLVEELEGKMHKLAKKEDYEGAAAIRDELSLTQVDDEANVLQANAELYASFSKNDIKRMKALWLEAHFVQCIHPMQKRASGYTDVCASWEQLFKIDRVRKYSISPEDVRMSLRGSTAYVTCTELLKGHSAPVKRMVATNIFRKVESRWYLVHRHVSSATDAAVGFGDSLMDVSDAEALSALKWQEREQQMRAFLVGARVIRPRSGSSYADEDEDNHDMFGADLDDPDSEEDEIDESDEESDDSDAEYYVEDENGVEDARDTVRALRRLSKQGALTQEAKIQLLSEMLKTPGESMPERAHALLLADVPEDEKKAAWEEFAALVAQEVRRLDVARGGSRSSAEGRRGNSSSSGPKKGNR